MSEESKAPAALGRSIAELFNTVYDRFTNNPMLCDIWRRAMHDEYIDGSTNFSFVGTSDVRFVCNLIRESGGTRVLDLGCGNGHLSYLVARDTNASVFLVDISRVAVTQARERFGILADQHCFIVSDFDELALADRSVDFIFSFDSLQSSFDKSRCAIEVARVMRDGGRLAFSFWRLKRPLGDLIKMEPLLKELHRHGFVAESTLPIDPQLQKQKRIYSLIAANRKLLLVEVGSEFVGMMMREAIRIHTISSGIQHCMIVMRKETETRIGPIR